MGEEHDVPCRDLQYFKITTERENRELRQELRELMLLIRQQVEMIVNQDKRIALLEQQNKLTFWVYGVITVSLIGIIIRLLSDM